MAEPGAAAVDQDDRLGPDQQCDQILKYTTAPPPCAWGPPRPSRSCGASSTADPSTRRTELSRSRAARCARHSPATTSPTRTCAARSTTGSRSWRTGTPPTTTCYLFYGKDGDLTGSGKESQEFSMLALHLLQSPLVHVNTLLLQDILSREKWQKRLTDADRRALSPLFWTHMNPYGRFELDMNSHLELSAAAVADTVPGPCIAPVAPTAQPVGGTAGQV
ncbi:transposase [Streptomyces sp. SID8499]|nr:transposase [Streptomyces sp. SID8499]